jgi:hypothetical protein
MSSTRDIVKKKTSGSKPDVYFLAATPIGYAATAIAACSATARIFLHFLFHRFTIYG